MKTISIIGNLGRDPELRNTNGGDPVCRFSVGVSKKDKSTVWFDVTAFGKTGELLARTVKKGEKLYVSGEFELREWQDKEGQKRVSPGVILREFAYCGGKAHQAEERQPGIDDDSVPF